MIPVYRFIPTGSLINLIKPITNQVLKEKFINREPNFLNQHVLNEEFKINNSMYFLNQTIQYNPDCSEYKQTLNLKTSILTSNYNKNIISKFSVYEDIDIILDNSNIKTYNYVLDILGDYNLYYRPQLFHFELSGVKTNRVLDLTNRFDDLATYKMYDTIKKQIENEINNFTNVKF